MVTLDKNDTSDLIMIIAFAIDISFQSPKQKWDMICLRYFDARKEIFQNVKFELMPYSKASVLHVMQDYIKISC